MRIGVALSPTAGWPEIVAATRLADQRGLESVGFWDHYHSLKPEWAYVCGWSAYGALAALTERIRLVPMVLCRLSYTLGVLAKESSILSIASGGRFELAIGAGDYPQEYAAWHQPFPAAAERVAALAEHVAALREIWRGELVTFDGQYVQLTDAACTPAPPAPPRVVVGVGGSRRMVRSAAAYADELNVYADEALLDYARAELARAGRDVPISVYLHWYPWPADPQAALAKWAALGVSRAIVSVGFDLDIVARVGELAELRATADN
jgi:alkanesulfonate monooxygenase SsuD/methylene tetrahydromethanopterin reductase-like flavin-dependent oxidoreductase (luciferase family)